MKHQHLREASDPRDRGKISYRIIADALHEAWRGRMRSVGAEDQRIAVGRGARHEVGRDRSICTWLRFDEDALLKRDTEGQSDGAGEGIGGAARAERHN